MREVTTARDSLVALQGQLDSELGKVVEQKNDLLPQYGLPEGESPNAENTAQGVPQVDDQEARESLGRFQKLCRDAKRRAIGVA